MVREIEIKTPKYETILVGEDTQIIWETSDGKQFDNEATAEHHEFYNCKVKHRGHNLPVERVEIFDFACIEDLNRYEKEYMYNDYERKYDKNKLAFPNTFVMYQEFDPDWVSEDPEGDWNYDDRPDTHLHIVTLDEYKKLLIDALQKLQ
jgi:hypothetical protein